MVRRGAIAFAAATLLALLAISNGPALARTRKSRLAAPTVPPIRTSVAEVSEGLACQCGCGLTVANCNHPQCSFSVPIREQIETMVQRGMSRDQVLVAFRQVYGEKVLSAPTTEGFNLLAWMTPFAALAAGAMVLFMTLGRWRSSTVPTPPAASALEPIDPRLKEILEREVREQF